MQSQNINPKTQILLVIHDVYKFSKWLGYISNSSDKRWLKGCFHINSPVGICAFYGNAHLVKPEKSNKLFSWEKQKPKPQSKTIEKHQTIQKPHKQNRIIVSNS